MLRRLEGHDPASRVPDVTIMVPVSADPSIHDVRDTGGLRLGLPGLGHLDAAILRALGGFVRGDGLRLAEPRAEIMSGFAPCEIRYCITASARFCDSTSFEVTPSRFSAGSIGALSV